MSRQAAALNHLLGDVQRRVFALEEATAAAREDLAVAREVDAALAEVLDGLLEDVSADC